MNTKSVLTLGEVVKIPVAKTVTPVVAAKVKPPVVKAADTTTSIKVVSAPGTLIPQMHVVAKGESLYTLSKKYNTMVAQLKAWNHLASNTIVDGHSLIVGYMATTNVMRPHIAPAESQSQPQPQPSALQDSILNMPPQTQTTVQDTVASQPVVESAAPVVTAPPAPQPAAPPVEQTPQPSATPPAVDIANIPAEGYFTSSFGVGLAGHKVKTVTGTSMAFKTTSGWNDKKYYILINNVPPGSIVKVMTADNKVIYAKVLWGVTGMKENEGLDFRISTAAAAALGLNDAKFPLTVTFYE